MPKLRLRQSDRNHLIDFAMKVVTADEKLAQEERTLYEEAKPKVLAVVRKKYPLKDMEILEKYKKAHKDKCIKVSAPEKEDSSVVEFRFDDPDVPIVAQPTYKIPPYEIDPDGYDAVAKWREAYEASEDDRKQRLTDYTAFIRGCRNLEDVTEIWPEAEKCREAIAADRNGYLVSTDVMMRVKEDYERRTSGQKA